MVGGKLRQVEKLRAISATNSGSIYRLLLLRLFHTGLFFLGIRGTLLRSWKRTTVLNSHHREHRWLNAVSGVIFLWKNLSFEFKGKGNDIDDDYCTRYGVIQIEIRRFLRRFVKIVNDFYNDKQSTRILFKNVQTKFIYQSTI